MHRRLHAHLARSLGDHARAWVWAVAAATTLSGCLNIPSAETASPDVVATAPTTADELLTRYVEALGGLEAVRAQAQRTVEARIEFEIPCDEEDPALCPPTPTGSFLLVNTANGEMYRRIVVRPLAQEGQPAPNAVVTERGFDGTQGWEVQAGPPTLLSVDATRERTRNREDALLTWFLEPAARGIVPELIGVRTEEAEDGAPPRTLDGLAWRAEDKSLVGRSYWFDRRTGLLAEERDEDPTQEDAARIVRYEDYRPVDGVLVAHAITQVTRVRVEGSEAPVEDAVRIQVTRVHHEAKGLPQFSLPTMPTPDPAPDEASEAMLAAKSQAVDAPSDVTAAMTWARAAWRLGDFGEVLAATAAALRADKKEPEALWLRARASIMRGEFRDARRLLSQARKAGVSAQQLEQQLGLIEIRERKFKASARRFEKLGLTNLAARFASFGDKGLVQRWRGDDCVHALEGAATPDGLIFEVRIDDTPVRLIFDSSVASVVLDQQMAIRMLISTDATSPLGQSGLAIGHGRIEQLELGAVGIKDVPVDLYPPQLIAEAIGGAAVDGIVGPRVFEQLMMHVVPDEGRVELVRNDRRCARELDARRGDDGIPYAVQDVGNLLFMGRVNEARGVYLFNTGLRGAAVAATAAAYARAGVGTPTLYGDRPGAPFVAVDQFIVGDVSLPAQTAVWGFQEQPNPDGIRVDGMFGTEAFGGRAWSIDFPAQRLYVVPAAAPAPATATAEVPEERP